MVKVKVNNVEVEVPQEAYIIDAVEKAGFRVPLLCYLQGLFNEATCRVCVVKANGRVVPACRFPVQEGMNIVTSDDELEKMRKINFELLLATHNIHCWDCYRKSTCTLSTLSRELGVEGIPVCSECPLYGEECLVKQGIPCLGPLTVAGCDAECTRQSAPCIGCRGFTSSIDVWRNAIKYYRDNGISREHLESALSIFWVVIPVKLREIINEVYKQ
ncbi:MAG: 2Fe-2S iron-sulfur cluster-binding protein [Desulfurococcaceae archaeon]|jgi:sulfur carrier protein ThiS